MAKSLFRIAVVAWALGQSAVLSAQVMNPPAPQADGAGQTALTGSGVRQAGGPAGSAQSGEVEQTGWGGIPLPKITMPKITMPKVSMPSMDAVTAPMKSGFNKVTTGTKKAWEGTKEIFTFGGQEDSDASSKYRSGTPENQSFWQRLTAQPPEPQGPQTVGEFMRQPRLQP